ncbi:hypothetical protein [Porphyromonas sp.]|uniref:hypothetical protein n=1 Tax=Porphyromonas sp. TaxID=1924944 RepID=UPI0026DB40D8|nr:hypothetical protein [Porphyromonas sp.]MDO4771297.1 hypothetical protein [Porphyromonas sp.]
MKKLLPLAICGLLSVSMAAQTKRTVLSAQVHGFQRDMIYFDCVQSPLIKAEFHTNPGEEHHFAFDTDEMVTLTINGKTKVFLEPGDSIHVNIRYEGKKIAEARFSGDDRAMAGSNLYRTIDQVKANMKYRSNLLGLVVLDVKPKDRFRDSHKLLQVTSDLLQKNADKISPAVAEYISAETEALAYTSFMEYPVMYADTRKLPIDRQEIGEYWSVMDGYNLRSSMTVLRCPEYVSLLMRYCFFQKEKEAARASSTYKAPNTLEDMYRLFADFYSGDQRDHILFRLMSNFILGGKELERVDPLFEEYKAKYNTDQKNAHILERLLQ